MKLIDAYNVEGLYNRLSLRTDLSVKTTYKLLKFFESIKKDAEFYKEELLKILNKYAERDENGKVQLLDDGQDVKIKEKELSNFNKEVGELTEIEVPDPPIRFLLSEIPEGLSVQEFSLLMPFIDGE